MICTCNHQLQPHDPIPGVCPPSRIEYNPNAPVHMWDEAGVMTMADLLRFVKEMRTHAQG